MNWIQQYSFIDVVCLSTRKCEKMSWIYLPIFYTNLDALTSKDSCNKSADAFIEERVEHRSPSSSWNAYCTGSFVWVKRACNQRLRNTCSNGENKLWYLPSMADSCWYRYSLLLTSLIVVNEILVDVCYWDCFCLSWPIHLWLEELVRNKYLEDANKVFLRGAKGGLRATDEIYDLMIAEDCKAGDHSNALEIAYEMEAAGRMATTFHFNHLLSCQVSFWMWFVFYSN